MGSFAICDVGTCNDSLLMRQTWRIHAKADFLLSRMYFAYKYSIASPTDATIMELGTFKKSYLRKTGAPMCCETVQKWI